MSKIGGHCVWIYPIKRENLPPRDYDVRNTQTVYYYKGVAKNFQGHASARLNIAKIMFDYWMKKPTVNLNIIYAGRSISSNCSPAFWSIMMKIRIKPCNNISSISSQILTIFRLFSNRTTQHKKGVNAIAITNTDCYVATADGEGAVFIWNWKTLKLKKLKTGILLSTLLTMTNT